MKGSWGILGGAFDPIHRGHINLAGEIRKKKNLDGILLVPSLRPPHKKHSCVASFDQRVRMAELAVAEDPTMRVSRIEEEIDGPGYTLNLMRHIKASFPGVAFSFIVGSDIIHEFKSWHEPELILKEMPLLVGTRDVQQSAATGADVLHGFELVETELVDVSSSDVRTRIKNGIGPEELAGLVGKAVADYVEREGLYR